MPADHPVQPVFVDPAGVLRFKENRIVRRLLEAFPGGMNRLAEEGFPAEDWEQLAQLIGYSVSGFSSLSYARTSTVAVAQQAPGARTDAEARLDELRRRTDQVRDQMRAGVALLYGLHPDDLQRLVEQRR